MSNYWNNQLCLPATELSATMTGSSVLIGTLVQSPVKIIFDNQSTDSVAIYINGTTSEHLWKTFEAGSALVLDQDLYTLGTGTRFYGVGASGSFYISYLYLRQ